MDIYEEAGSFFTSRKTDDSPVVIIGAGERGKIWANFLQNMNIPIYAACDNQKTGYLKTHYLEKEYPQEYYDDELIRIVKPEDLDKSFEYCLIFTMDSAETQQKLIDQLEREKIKGKAFLGESYQKFPIPARKERVISYAENQEDLILYHALKRYNNIFYIDVGANDAWYASLTQLFYSRNLGRGVNIDGNILYYQKLVQMREKDINLNIAIGDITGEVNFPLDYGGEGTLNEEFINLVNQRRKITNEPRYAKVQLDTLANIIKKYVPPEQEIHFCKIDTEGYEEKCLLGIDWNLKRPWIFCIESVLETSSGKKRTDMEWEYILKNNGYSPALMDLNNKYYVANEHIEIASDLLPRWYLFQLYECIKLNPIQTHNLKPEDTYYWHIKY